jgi:hypothetical protein
MQSKFCKVMSELFDISSSSNVLVAMVKSFFLLKFWAGGSIRIILFGLMEPDHPLIIQVYEFDKLKNSTNSVPTEVI